MKTTILLLLALATISFQSTAQTLSEQLGGVKTTFIIVSDGVDIQASNQVIIERAENETYANSMGDTGEGYAYGYQSFHLEFEAEELLQEKKFRYKLRGPNPRMILEFYDAEGNLLTTLNLAYRDVTNTTNEEGLSTALFYSVDLKNVPISILDQTVKIDITRWTRY